MSGALADEIASLVAAGAAANRDEARATFARLRAALSSGEARAAEPDPSAPGGWRVNTWVKQGILLGFRHGDTSDVSADHGRWPFFDKDTLPLKRLTLENRVRIIPGGSSVRDGAYLGAGVICVPPMYINIGAWVGEGTLIDSHALVGSCAQIGARVHVSAAAQIGGVLEPVGALPVIVEDDVLIGGNCGVYEGTVVKRRAVLAAGTILTGSTPIYDLPNERIIEPVAGQPLIVPEGAVVVPGSRPITRGAGQQWGLSVATPIIVKYRDERRGPAVGPLGGHADHRQIPGRTDGRADRARSMDSLETIAFARALIDIDSTTGRERAAGDWLAGVLRERGYTVTEQPLARGCANVLATLDDPVVVLSTHFDCVPPFIPSSLADGRLYGRGACDAKGILAAQLAAAERLRAAGERRVGLLFVVGEERGSDGAALANTQAPGSRYLVNGEPTDSKLATATRGVLRVKLHARGRACHSAAPEHGVSAIDLLIDALIRLRTLPLPVDPELGATYYTVGLIEGGVAPNVVSPHASAEVLFRIVGEADEVLAAIAPLASTVAIEEVLRVRTVKLHVVDGIDSAVFPFTTDVPLLGAWGTPLLFGPGSFLVAHTDEEQLDLRELEGSVETYQRLVRQLLE